MSSTLRITGGEHRGRRIPVPRDHQLRPTSDKARQAFFNIVGEHVVDAKFLDLFAGTGIFSLEALSRGAARAVAVDVSKRAATQLDETASRLGVELEVVTADVFKALTTLSGEPFDIVFADPPYDFSRYDDLLRAIDTLTLSDDAVVGVEHSSARVPFTSVPPMLPLRKTAHYGTVAISIFDRSGPE